MTATQKVHVIRLLPLGNAPAAREERSHLEASRWLIPGAPKNEGQAGRAYAVTPDIAANLLRKGWTLCNPAGAPIEGEIPTTKPVIRNGTAEWYALPLDQRPGTEEYRAAQLEIGLQRAYEAEQAIVAEQHAAGAHDNATIEDCPACAARVASAAEQPQKGAQDAPQTQGEADASQPGTDGTTTTRRGK